jgi:hypothetical protein
VGVAIDTIGTFVTAGATNPTSLKTVTVSTGDSLQVRSFPAANQAWLEQLFYEGATKGKVRVESPLFHDNVTGITLASADTSSNWMMGQYLRQPVRTTDTLAAFASAAAGASGILALSIYYQNLPSSNARLANWGDISGVIKSIKGLEVDVTTSGTIGTWQDTAINTTDKQLHANTDYAVIGYEIDAAVAVVGVKGNETGNLRVCGPGVATTIPTPSYFADLAQKLGTPHIPVFNSNNQGAYFVSTLANVASVASKVYLLLAELSTPAGQVAPSS